MIYRIATIIASLFLLFGCSENKHDERLLRIAETVSDSPEEALDSLDSIDSRPLSTSDSYFYDFLTLKACDKAYILHTSDSLYLRIYDYYSQRKDDDLYPEVLYYGGRVYSDLGDYPTALSYFQRSVDCLSDNDSNPDLRSRAYSQTGRLLTTLRLYDEAIPYIEAALDVNRQTKDTTNLIHNLLLLGGTYLMVDNYPSAETYFRESLEISTTCSLSSQIARSRMYLAALKYKLGQTDSALLFIRNVPNNVKQITRNTALAHASNIYLDAGLLDSAYMYSHELISSPDPQNKQIGYQVILSPELRSFIHPDSLDKYIDEYRGLLEHFYNENENQLAVNQQSLYNYQLHEREKDKAEKSNEKLWQWIIGFIFAVATMLIVILLLKNKNKKNIIELQQAIQYISDLEREIKNAQSTPLWATETETDGNISNHDESVNQPILSNPAKNTESELRALLKNKLMALYESCADKTAIPSAIYESEPYQELLKRISSGKTINDDDGLWSELEETVITSSPRFKTNLNLLTSGKLTVLDLHTALLIKCGIKPSQMTILLGRSNGAIISRRESLCIKIFDEKLGVKVIDGIIHLL